MIGDVFDPKSEFLMTGGCRPHWSQAGAVVFLTFRTADSIPREVVLRWEREQREWLKRLDVGPIPLVAESVAALPETEQLRFRKHFNRCRETCLDECHGRCVLKRPELAKIVADSLLHFDGDRYRMGDFVVMPNHVHLLAAFPNEDAMKKQCDSWLHFTAFQINKALGAKGKFWQQEPFDHLVRSVVQYEHLRLYIADNPKKARLRPGEYLYRRREG
jgi:putative transposase